MLIVIASDPRTSHRPAEAIRVASGLASMGSVPIEVCFCEAAALVLSQEADRLIDGEIIKKYLPLLARSAQSVWAESGDPCLQGTEQIPYTRIGLTELSQLAKTQNQVIRF
jgi:hypothetical protein